MKLEELVEQFALNVAAQTEAIWRGDAKTGNKHARKYGAAVDKLLAHGDAGRDALLVLLKRVDLEGLPDHEAKAIRELKIMLETVADIKERHGVKHVLKPSWP